MFNKATSKVKGNVVGALVGAGATYWAVGKYANVSRTWLRLGLAVLGGVAGAYAQSAITAKKSAPKAATVK